MATLIDDAERERLHDQFSVYPDAELLFLLLGWHKMLEYGQIARSRANLEREAVVLGEVFMRWVPAEPFEEASEMLYGDGEPRFPDVSALGGSDDG